MTTQVSLDPIAAGDTLVLVVTAKRKDKATLINLTGATVYAGFRSASVSVALSSPATGIVITDAINGVSTITVSKAQTLSLLGPCDFDVVVVEADGTRSTIIQGTMPVVDHPTKS